MSDKAATSAKPQSASSTLVNLYKPVGIAALNAATLCKGQKIAVKGAK
ncbi:hypothetical protein [Roseibium suaedae]|uniref:Uncharacterized protein n=1 Tax=Roseibium suaedae TaxID=735517 RepID=A0A1M7B9Z0_9HYPH|nr:hypothetical protein [Roseibium suaedae]SHL51747.1 hypothetical protein SAMN05444272_0768 [Roseibium suaedae]